MIEHSERAFYYHDKIKFWENSEFKAFNCEQVGARQDKGNSQEEIETFLKKQKKENKTKQTVGDVMKNISSESCW